MIDENKKYLKMNVHELANHRTELFDSYKFDYAGLVSLLRARNMPIPAFREGEKSPHVLRKFYMDASIMILRFDSFNFDVDNILEYPPQIKEMLFWVELYKDIERNTVKVLYNVYF